MCVCVDFHSILREGTKGFCGVQMEGGSDSCDYLRTVRGHTCVRPVYITAVLVSYVPRRRPRE